MDKTPKTDWRYEEIEKTLGWRISELVQSLLVLRDAIYGCRNDMEHQLIPLSGQLRALLTDSSQKKPQEPLLFAVAKAMQKELRLYAMPDTDESKPPIMPSIHIAGFPVSLVKEFPAHEEILLEDLLKKKIVYINDKYWAVQEVIDWFANKAGGAHFDPKMPADFAQLLPLLKNPLLQLGEITLLIGHKFIKELADFEIHFLFAVPILPKEKVFLFDAQYSKNGMRISLLLDHLGKLELRLKDIQNNTIAVQSLQMLDWSEVSHIMIRVNIKEDLTTKIEIMFNGQVVAFHAISIPFFISSNIKDYNMFHNRAADGKEQSFEFGLAEMSMHGIIENQSSQARLLVYFDEERKKDRKCMIYKSKSYGHAGAGVNDLKMYGKVQMASSIQNYLRKRVGSE